MIRDNFKTPPHASRQSKHDRVVDWLGAQGPLMLTIYMCGIIALVAFLADAMR